MTTRDRHYTLYAYDAEGEMLFLIESIEGDMGIAFPESDARAILDASKTLLPAWSYDYDLGRLVPRVPATYRIRHHGGHMEDPIAAPLPSAHAACTHPATKAGRAACRKARRA